MDFVLPMIGTLDDSIVGSIVGLTVCLIVAVLSLFLLFRSR